MNEIVKMPWVSEELEIKCPKCGSYKIVLKALPDGCYDFLQCYNCGYQNKNVE